MDRAKRDLRRLQASHADLVTRRLARLRRWPDHGADVRRVRGAKQVRWRLRVGTHRAIFGVDDAQRLIIVVRIEHRIRAYR
jgi:mRNA-degrading endonuclease RelE of RelBE toxin-antitoxin system